MNQPQPPKASIRGLMLATLLVAIASAAMARNSDIWNGVVTNLHLAAIIACSLSTSFAGSLAIA